MDSCAGNRGTQPANNPFDYLDGEWATSQDFQRNTVRMWGLIQMPFVPPNLDQRTFDQIVTEAIAKAIATYKVG